MLNTACMSTTIQKIVILDDKAGQKIQASDPEDLRAQPLHAVP